MSGGEHLRHTAGSNHEPVHIRCGNCHKPQLNIPTRAEMATSGNTKQCPSSKPHSWGPDCQPSQLTQLPQHLPSRQLPWTSPGSLYPLGATLSLQAGAVWDLNLPVVLACCVALLASLLHFLRCKLQVVDGVNAFDAQAIHEHIRGVGDTSLLGRLLDLRHDVELQQDLHGQAKHPAAIGQWSQSFFNMSDKSRSSKFQRSTLLSFVRVLYSLSICLEPGLNLIHGKLMVAEVRASIGQGFQLLILLQALTSILADGVSM